MLKAAIVLLLIATVVSLFSGLFFLVKDESQLQSSAHRLECSSGIGRCNRRLDSLGLRTADTGVPCET
jgi:hypothetical protein